MAVRIRNLLMVACLLVLFGNSLATSATYWDIKPRVKGDITVDTVLSLYIDAFVHDFIRKTDGFTWSETDKSYNNPNFPAGQSAGGMTLGELFSYEMLYIAFDGTDQQVARTGLSREELLRRALLKYPLVRYSGNAKTKVQWDAVVKRASDMWASGQTAQPAVMALRPTPTKIYVGFNQYMDYGQTDNWFMLRPVAQDFADPRIVGGKPIKEWATKYRISSGSSGHPEQDGADLQPCYAPDFSGDHHNNPDPIYSVGAGMFHAGQLEGTFLVDLLAGNIPKLQWRNPLSHLKDQSMLVLRHTTGHGFYCTPSQYYSPNRFKTNAALLYSVYGVKEALGFLARQLESRIRTGNLNMIEDYDADREMVAAYLCLRLPGVNLGACPPYKEASKIVHGSYWYKYFRYGIHRTPDKLVLVGWNGKSRKITVQGRLGDTEYSEAGPMNSSFYSPGSLQEHNQTGFQSSADFVTSQVVPDNDDSMPENEYYLVRSHGRMQGSIDNRGWNNAATEVRENRSDAILSTVGDMDVLAGDYSLYAKQYQSFTSFYDKTSISMVQIRPGANGQGKNWMGGFSTSFNTSKAKPIPGQTCYYEGDSLDLNPYAIYALKSESNYYDGTTFKDITGSKWWSVNGRLGIAVLGGDQGNFKIYPANGVPSRYDSHADYYCGTMIGYFAPLGTPDAKGNQLSMAAAYFVCTPPAKVKALQTTMVSIDDQLPDGWKGVTSSTPDDQRVLALARFYGVDNQTANVKLSFPEGAPVLESVTSIIGDTARAGFTFDTLESWGQTMAFYVSGATDTVVAEQIGDIAMRIKGKGSVILKYLPRADANTLYIDGVASSKTKQELVTGVTVALTQNWTTVRVINAVDEDHTGPAVEVMNPEYITQFNCRGIRAQTNITSETSVPFWDPQRTVVPETGLKVNIRSRDRSGVAYVKIFLDWVQVDSIAQPANEVEITIPMDKFESDSIHAIHAVACDNLGNEEESFSVPFKVTLGQTGIEFVQVGRNSRRAPVGAVSVVSRQSENSGVVKQVLSAKPVNIMPFSSGGETWIACGRVKPDAQGVMFSYAGADYVMGLSAKTYKVGLYRKGKENSVLVGEAAMKVSFGKWYDLKVKAVDGNLVGYVNGEAKIAVEN